MALLLAKQRLTQQAKEARDLKAKEVEEVEVEARTAREGSAQSTRNSSTRSCSPMIPAQWAAGLQNALDGETCGSNNSVSRRISSCLNNSRSKSRRRCDSNSRLLAHSKAGQPCLWKGRRAVWRRYRLGVRRKTTVGDFFGQSRDSNHIKTRARPENADRRSMAYEAGPHGFSW